MKEVKFSMQLAEKILKGEVKAKVFSVDDHDIQLKEIKDGKLTVRYVNYVHKGGDGPIEDKSHIYEVDENGYFLGEKYRILSIGRVLVPDNYEISNT